MSVAAEAGSGIGSRLPSRLRPSHAYFFLVSLAWLALLAWNLVRNGRLIAADAGQLIPWIVLLAVVNMLPVTTWQHGNYTADIPITIAGMLILSPFEVGFVTFLGTLDPKELRGRIPVVKTLFNRSQISLAVFLGSLAAHSFVRAPSPSPFMVPLAFLVLVSMASTNYLLAGVGISLEHGYSVSQALQRMRIGSLFDFALTLVSWGILGAMLAALYDQIGLFALGAFLAPTLLGRQALIRSQMSIDTARAYRSREAALAQISHRIYEERSDERRLIAADLHDEVLQPLFRVTLMAQVLKTDLASGQLLEMDQDLPELLTAADLASTSLRELIGDLRQSALGRGGLGQALQSFVNSLSKHSTVAAHTRIQRVRLDADSEMVLYQIAKEALGNAFTHSRAANVWVELFEEAGMTRLTIRDDGVGFDPLEEPAGHYGIAIMRERASTVGADLFIDSLPGRGSSVDLSLRVVRPSPE